MERPGSESLGSVFPARDTIRCQIRPSPERNLFPFSGDARLDLAAPQFESKRKSANAYASKATVSPGAGGDGAFILAARHGIKFSGNAVFGCGGCGLVFGDIEKAPNWPSNQVSRCAFSLWTAASPDTFLLIGGGGGGGQGGDGQLPTSSKTGIQPVSEPWVSPADYANFQELAAGRGQRLIAGGRPAPAPKGASNGLTPAQRMAGGSPPPAAKAATETLTPAQRMAGGSPPAAPKAATDTLTPAQRMAGGSPSPAAKAATDTLTPAQRMAGGGPAPAGEGATDNLTPAQRMGGGSTAPAAKRATATLTPAQRMAGGSPGVGVQSP
jgi:hypothetical protein